MDLNKFSWTRVPKSAEEKDGKLFVLVFLNNETCFRVGDVIGDTGKSGCNDRFSKVFPLQYDQLPGRDLRVRGTMTQNALDINSSISLAWQDLRG